MENCSLACFLCICNICLQAEPTTMANFKLYTLLPLFTPPSVSPITFRLLLIAELHI